MAAERYRRFTELTLIGAGFGLVNLMYPTDWAGWAMAGSRMLVFWAGIYLQGSVRGVSLGALLALRFSAGTGFSLLYLAFIGYAFRIEGDLNLLLLESCAATLLLAAWQALSPDVPDRRKIVFAGQHALPPTFLPQIGRPVLGSIAGHYSGMPYLGDWDRFEEVVRRESPVEVVISPGVSSLPPGTLWQLWALGAVLESPEQLYERLFQRIPINGLRPMDLVVSDALRANSRVMAIQAVYTNLIGLTLLIMLSPVLLGCGVLILFTSRGSVLESVGVVPGSRKIPFRLFRFRGHRSDGTRTFAGRWIARLSLENLPQLHQCGAWGDGAVWSGTGSARICCLVVRPVAVLRAPLSVKPGVFGWAQIHEQGPMDELLRLEYDLYYIKQGSLLLDVEIFLRSMRAQAHTFVSKRVVAP